MGSFSCAARLTAKTFTLSFCFVLFCLGIGTSAVGMFSIQQFYDTFLADAIPTWASYTIFAVGIMLTLFAAFAFIGTACCLHNTKVRLLCPLVFLTVIFAAFFTTSTIVAFRYGEVMRIAAETGFADDVDGAVTGFYQTIRDAYVNSYTECNATAYMTENVKTMCQVAANWPGNTLDVSQCASDAYDGGVNRVGMYCRDGPGIGNPFTVDKALAFPPLTSSFDVHDVLRLRSLGYFMSAVCMPTTTRYYELMAELIALQVPSILLPPTVSANAANSHFGKCFQSQWWEQNDAHLSPRAQAAIRAQPAIPTGFQRLPNGTAFDENTNFFFTSLQASRAALLGNPFLSAKASFCFCADDGSESKLLSFVRDQVFRNVQWGCLALAIFFGVALVAEIYLGCCVTPIEDSLQSSGAKTSAIKLRGWQAGGASGTAVPAANGVNPAQHNAQNAAIYISP